MASRRMASGRAASRRVALHRTASRLRAPALAALVTLLLFLLSVAGCGPASGAATGGAGTPRPSEASGAAAASEPAQAGPVTVVDDSGESLSFASPPARIVSLVPGATDLILALGASDRIVAIDGYSAAQFPDLSGLPTLDGYNVDFEALVALKPDLVLTLPGPYLDQMHHLGLPVFIANPADAEGVERDLRVLGQALGLEAAGEAAAGRIADEVERVERQLAGVGEGDRVKVFFEASTDPIFSAGKGSYVDFLISSGGGVNIFGDAGTPYPQVTAEEVVARAPDVIVGPEGDAALADLKAKGRPGWESVPAVRDGRIYILDDALVVQADTHVAEAVRALAHAFYPDLVPARSEGGS